MLRLACFLFMAGAATAAAPEVGFRLGERPGAPPPEGLTLDSSTVGSDRLECLREGEWSVGHLELKSATAAPDDRLVLRIVGGAALAPVPTLVRTGERETYVRNAHRDGADVVASVPYPAKGAADSYELVDLSSSVEWRTEPALEADPRDKSPLGERRALVFIPADDEPQGRHARDSRFAPFRVVRESPAYAELLDRTKPYLFRYPAYAGGPANAAALVRVVRALGADRVALIAHGNGAAIMRLALENAALSKRVTGAFTLSSVMPASLLESLSTR